MNFPGFDLGGLTNYQTGGTLCDTCDKNRKRNERMSDSHLDSLELSSSEAGQILNVSTRTINRYVKREMLTARLQGMKRVARISIDDLRTFAESYGFVVNEVVVEEIAAARKK